MPVFRVAFVLHNTLKKPVFTFTRFTLETPKTLENKGKIQYFQGLSNLPAAGLEPAKKPLISMLFRHHVAFRVA